MSGRSAQSLARFIAWRLAIIPISLLLIATISFAIVNLLPGDPALQIAGDFATPEEIERINTELGRSGPLLERYVDYVGGLLRFDLGESYFSGEEVSSTIGRLLPNTVELMVAALAIALFVGLAIGILSAYFEHRAPDRIGRGIVTVVQAMPDFVIGLVLIYVFFYLLGWAPSPTGRLSLMEQPPERRTGLLLLDCLLAGDRELFWSAVRHMVLPSLTLGLAYSTYIAKSTRSALTQALASPQAEFARASGLTEMRVVIYSLRVARTPILTYGAIIIGAMVGGAAIVETIFAWPGLGKWALDSIYTLDLPSIQGFIVLTGGLTLVLYVLLDLLVIVLDPRVKTGRAT